MRKNSNHNIFKKEITLPILSFLIFGCFFFNYQSVSGQTSSPYVPGKIRTELGYKTTAEVEQFEAEKNVREGASFMLQMVPRVAEEGPVGSLLRRIGGVTSPFTYDSPLTRDFFSEVGKVDGSEMEKISRIYQLTTEAVPNYGTPGSDTVNLNIHSTFEEILSSKGGICRDQAALLNAALKKQGIDSRMVTNQNHDHMWVRVHTSTGEEFDLDPTWYKDFVKLKPREVDPDLKKCNSLSYTSLKKAILDKLVNFNSSLALFR